MYNQMKTKFDTKVNKAQYHIDWSLLTYFSFKAEKSDIGKTNLEVLQTVLDKLQLCQRDLGLGYMGENQLIAATQRACRGVSELEFALFTPATTFEELSSKLRSSIITHDNRNAANTQYFTDRQFGRHDRGDQYNKGNNTYNRYDNKHNGRKPWRGKCYVCGKEGCCSNKHSDNEQQKAKKNFGDETENSAEIKANTTHFWLIMKGIQMMILTMSMKKQIIQKTTTKIIRNMSWLPIFLTNLSCIS